MDLIIYKRIRTLCAALNTARSSDTAIYENAFHINAHALPMRPCAAHVRTRSYWYGHVQDVAVYLWT